MFERDNDEKSFEASKVVLHEAYDGVYHDLALVTLARSLPANLTSAKAVCLPKSGSRVDVSGKVYVRVNVTKIHFLRGFFSSSISRGNENGTKSEIRSSVFGRRCFFFRDLPHLAFSLARLLNDVNLDWKLKGM